MSIGGIVAIWAAGGLLALLCLFFAIRAGRRLRFLIDTPTSKAKGVFVGMVEVTGRASTAEPVRTLLAGQDAVWFHFEIEEEWERWETEITQDSKGNTQTRQVLRTGWTTVAKGGRTPPFDIKDDTGTVLVRPDGAKVEPEKVFDRTVGHGDPLYFGKGPPQEIDNSRHQRRFTERAIPLDAPLFVAGHARERVDAVAPEIAADRGQELFLISCRGEQKVQGGYRLLFWALGVAGLLPLPVAGWLVAAETDTAPNQLLLAGLAAGMAALWALAWLWMTFNSMVQLRNRVDQAWSLIDVQLKRRADLIPRLVGVVTGLRDHENRVQTEVATLRAQATAAAPGGPGVALEGTRSTMESVVENYPQLKADDAFLGLQRELSDTETRIALARDYFNGIATHHNTRLEIVPDRWIAPLAGLHPRPFFTAETFERAAVPVNFNESPAT